MTIKLIDKDVPNRDAAEKRARAEAIERYVLAVLQEEAEAGHNEINVEYLRGVIKSSAAPRAVEGETHPQGIADITDTEIDEALERLKARKLVE